MQSGTPFSARRDNLADGDNDLDLLQIWNTLSRGKYWILLYIVLAVLAGGYYAFRIAVPIYSSTTTIALQSREGQIVDFESPLAGLGGDFATVNTEIEILRSRRLLDKLVVELDLEADPDFNGWIREGKPSLIGGAIQLVKQTLFSTASEPVEPPDPQTVRDSVIDAVLASLSVSNLYASYVFYVTVQARDPKKAALIADTLSKLYIEDQIAVKYQATEQATIWLNGRVIELKAELETAENAVKSLSTDTDLISAETLEARNRQLKAFRDRLADSKAEAAAAQTRLMFLQAARDGGSAEAMERAAEDTVLTQAFKRLDTGGVAARAAFDIRFEQLLEQTRLREERATVRSVALAESSGELKVRIDSQSKDLLKIQQLKLEAQASRQIYEYFLGRLKEVSVQQGIHRADSRVLSPAVVAGRPTRPRKNTILLGSATFGLFLGAVFVLLREMRSTGFRSSQDLEQATGVNVLAQIPKAPFSARRRILKYLASKPTSIMAEAVRNLRTSVFLSNMDNPPQIIMMNSSLPGEGKTTQSLALGQSFAAMGKKVLLIEGDIRRRTFQEYFNLRNHPGLITAVSGQRPLEEIVYYSEDVGADILIGEKTTVNAADFFSSARFRSFLESLRSRYDVIIIDTPPVLVVPDARLIGRLADAVIFLVHWNRTTLAQVREGLRSLSNVDVKVSGLVLSHIDMKKARHYGGEYNELYSYYGHKYYSN